MEQKIETAMFGTTNNQETVRLFHIPNNTNDYIEVSSYGCTIKNICVHNRKGALQNLLRGFDTLEEYEKSDAGIGAIMEICTPAGKILSLTHKIWDVVDIGSNFVFLSCKATAEECGCGLALGARIMWVNLNRLVIDLYFTSEKDLSLHCACNLPFQLTEDHALEHYVVRTFCPQKLHPDGSREPVSGTAYGDLAFQPLGKKPEVFVYDDENMKPMAELANTEAGMTISAYGTMSSIEVIPDAALSCVRLNQTLMENVSLKAGESFTSRVIYGFDRLYTKEEMENPEPSPFSAFCSC
jgi:hypothetical protein